MQIITQNLDGLKPAFREKVERILHDMEKHLGYRCYVASGKRTPEQQAKLVAQGRSKTLRSKHLTGRAADIVPYSEKWNARQAYWMRLGYLAYREGLRWGGEFGLPAPMREALRKACEKKKWDADVKIGWDPAHVEEA